MNLLTSIRGYMNLTKVSDGFLAGWCRTCQDGSLRDNEKSDLLYQHLGLSVERINGRRTVWRYVIWTMLTDSKPLRQRRDNVLLSNQLWMQLIPTRNISFLRAYSPQYPGCYERRRTYHHEADTLRGSRASAIVGLRARYRLFASRL